ncbi:MAG: Swt1 family HEPN domain-containing protein, partial [Steroidobacteraceae bacterium]
MATTNRERVGKVLDLLRDGLRPYVEREAKLHYGSRWSAQLQRILADSRLGDGKGDPLRDVAVVLLVMEKTWDEVFRQSLGRAERTLLFELRDLRNKWAHQDPFSTDDAYRALDSASRLLTAVSAPEAGEVEKMKMELLRVRFDEQVRSEKRKSAGTAIESQATGNLTPW